MLNLSNSLFTIRAEKFKVDIPDRVGKSSRSWSSMQKGFQCISSTAPPEDYGIPSPQVWRGGRVGGRVQREKLINTGYDHRKRSCQS